MRRTTPVLVLALVIALGPSPAGAVTRTVRMLDTLMFSPRTAGVPLGSSIMWSNDSNLVHTSNSKKPYPTSWAKTVPPDTTWTKQFRFAGVFGYFCEPHSDGQTKGMIGSVEVPLRFSQRTGTPATRFTISVSTVEPPDGWAFQIQKRVGSGDWSTIRSTFERRSFTYRSAVEAVHRFRARLLRINGTVIHLYSPIGSITIS
jgi:plastocyanin